MGNHAKHRSQKRSIAEEHFRGMVESTAGIPWEVDMKTFQFTYVGPQAEKILGYPEEQWYETDFWTDHIHPDDRQEALDFCIAASQKGDDYNFEYRMIHRDGHAVWILDYVNIVMEDGEPVRLQGFMFDISKDKLAEQRLQERTMLLDAIYRASPDMIFIHANDGSILYINENASRRYGYSLEQMQQMSVADLSAEEDAANKVINNSLSAMRGEDPEFEWLARDSSGRPFPVEVRLRKLDGGDAPGAPAIIAVVRDITERKRTESALRESKADLDRAQQIAHIGSWSWNIATNQVTWSDEMYRIHGVDPGHAATDGWQMIDELAHPDDRDRVRATAEHALREGNDTVIRYRIVRPSGEIRHVIGHGSLVRDEQGQPLKRVGVVQDITEQQQAEQDLRNIAAGVSAQTGEAFHFRLVEHLARLFDAEYAFIGTLDQDDPQTVNTLAVWAHGRLSGNFSYSLEGTPCANVIGQHTCAHPTGIQQEFPDDRMLIDMGVDSYIGSPLFDSHGNATGLIVVLDTKPMQQRSYTTETLEIFAARAGAEIERNQAQAELKAHRDQLEELVAKRTEELKAINQELESFSYSVSHDLRAPLRHISSYSQILLEDHSAQLDAEGQSHLSRIHDRAQHMEQLIKDLLELSRVNRGAIEREPLQLSDMVQQIVDKLRHYNPERAISVDIAPGITAVADYRLTQIMLDNLMDNAWKYTSKTPQASVEFGAVTEHGEVRYFVRDNGAGFNMKYADKLFTAFKRLHAENQFEGTGIGLATVQRIVHRHGGKIWAEAEVDQGATFYFTLEG